jgi:hypothetical protein
MGNWIPSIVPKDDEEKRYLLVDDFGNMGRCWQGTDIEATDLEIVIGDLPDGQHNSPACVIGLNTVEGWSSDVSEELAEELQRRCDLKLADVPASLEQFVRRFHGADREQLTLRLV